MAVERVQIYIGLFGWNTEDAKEFEKNEGLENRKDDTLEFPSRCELAVCFKKEIRLVKP